VGSLLKGLGAGCLPWLVLGGALGVWHYRAMAPDLDGPIRLAAALLSSVLLALGLASFWGLLRGHGRGEQSRDALLRRARAGTAPTRDGPIIASGTVRALSSPLAAPFSGAPCVSYLYRMYYTVSGRQGAQEVPVYWGIASRAFALDGSTSSVRVLAVPELRVLVETRKDPAAVERARRLVAGTTFEERTGPLGAVGSALQMVEVLFTDDDGEVRRDWSNGERREPADLILEERTLSVGVVASAYGHWSAERRALVAQGPGSVTPAVEVALGPPETLLDEMPRPPASFRAYLASAILLTVAGLGLIWFTVWLLPTLR
jgi:hypothetical protein